MGERAILHLDMDAFYASVEQRDDPALRGRPLIVGGHPPRGVVLAASYEIRPFGVRSAMPMSQALRLCPDARVVPPRFEAYAEASDRVFAILGEVTPLIEPLSLDEAFLDVTASLRLFGAPEAIARRLRQRLATELSLPASAGVATSKFVAKIASDVAKPNGQRLVTAAETLAFLAPLPVSRIFGVGPKTEAVLHALGLRRIGDLRARGADWLRARLGDQGTALHALSLGRDDRPVCPDRQQQSLGAEDTFAADTLDPALLRTALHAQAWRVGRRLRRAGLRGRVVELKLKDEAFQITHRRCTLPTPTDDGQAIYQAALALLERAAPQRALRLIGVSTSDFETPVSAQVDLFAPPPGRGPTADRQRALNAALDRITDRYGPDAVRPSDLSTAADRAGPPTLRGTQRRPGDTP